AGAPRAAAGAARAAAGAAARLGSAAEPPAGCRAGSPAGAGGDRAPRDVEPAARCGGASAALRPPPWCCATRYSPPGPAPRRRAKGLRAGADRVCAAAACGSPDGLRLNDQGHTAATRANGLYSAGGATVATALVLWLVGAPGETVLTPTAGDRSLGVTMTGSF